MCDIAVYLRKDGEDQLVLENVDQVKTEEDSVRLVNLFGEEKTITGRLIYYNNTEKRMVFEVFREAA